jgi:hypothetical protein
VKKRLFELFGLSSDHINDEAVEKETKNAECGNKSDSDKILDSGKQKC